MIPVRQGSVRVGVGFGVSCRGGGLLSLDKRCGNVRVATSSVAPVNSLCNTNRGNKSGGMMCRVMNRPLKMFCLPRYGKLGRGRLNNCDCSVRSLGSSNRVSFDSNKSECVTNRTAPGMAVKSGVDFHCGSFSVTVRVGNTFNRGVFGNANLTCAGVSVFPSCGMLGNTPRGGVVSRGISSC